MVSHHRASCTLEFMTTTSSYCNAGWGPRLVVALRRLRTGGNTVQARHCTKVICKLFKGAVGAYLGCCRGCGAHLIWVTSIDAFSPKKSHLQQQNLNYFTVLHKGNRFTLFRAVSGTLLRKSAKSKDSLTALRTTQVVVISSVVAAERQWYYLQTRAGIRGPHLRLRAKCGTLLHFHAALNGATVRLSSVSEILTAPPG